MTTEPKVQYFLGANAPGGFYSLYDQLIDPARARAIYILKGGPGCGKSTLMRRVGRHMEDHGLAVEYIICSGDPESLDAIVIPERATAIVDGTAPHVVEPKYPGAVESYINLGECYDREALGHLRQEIMACMSDYKGCYQRAYRCLTAAAEIEEDVRELLLNDTLKEKIVKRARGILGREIKKKKGDTLGQVKQRFLSGITGQGSCCQFDTVDALCKRVYELVDSNGLSHLMLETLLAGAVAQGHDVVGCPSPMAPQRLEHLLIPELSLAFVRSCPGAEYPRQPYRRIRMDAMADKELTRRCKPRIRFSKKVSGALTEEAVGALAKAKAMHDDLEALYNPHVDFQRVNQMSDALAESILEGRPWSAC